jgi:hypothetical protein
MSRKHSSPPRGDIVFKTMGDANRGGAFTTVDGTLAARGENIGNLLRDLRDGLCLVVYSSGDDFFVNVSEWRLSHDALDRQREMVVENSFGKREQ